MIQILHPPSVDVGKSDLSERGQLGEESKEEMYVRLMRTRKLPVR